MIRNLPAHVMDELAALGSCIAVGIHANAVAQGIALRKLELEDSPLGGARFSISVPRAS